MAPLVIALGPGFSVGADADVIVETKRGHNLGRIIRSGSAAPNSGVPGNIAGYSRERVLHAPCAGVLHVVHDIGSIVEKGETIATITDGFKIADIDPRKEELANCFTISDKARCIAGSVLELVCRYAQEKQK